MRPESCGAAGHGHSVCRLRELVDRGATRTTTDLTDPLQGYDR